LSSEKEEAKITPRRIAGAGALRRAQPLFRCCGGMCGSRIRRK